MYMTKYHLYCIVVPRISSIVFSKFKEPPRDKSVIVGKDVVITTVVENVNTVVWKKDKVRVISISSNFKEDFNVTTGIATLSITKARFENAGKYVCVAEVFGNPKKLEKCEVHLYVLPGTYLFSLK